MNYWAEDGHVYKLVDGFLKVEARTANGHPLVLDGSARGEFHRRDFLLGGLFDDSQHALLALCDKEDRITHSSRSAGASDAMNIGFRIVRDVVIDDMTDAVNI